MRPVCEMEQTLATLQPLTPAHYLCDVNFISGPTLNPKLAQFILLFTNVTTLSSVIMFHRGFVRCSAPHSSPHNLFGAATTTVAKTTTRWRRRRQEKHGF